MTGPSSTKLTFELYQDATRTTLWGSAWHANVPLSVDITLSGGAGTSQKTFYGTVLGGQTGTVAGSYSGAVTSAVLLGFGYTTTPPTCATSGYTSWQGFQVNATATVASDCTMSATNLDFGQHGILNQPSTSTGVITATCTKDAPYSLALSAGTGAGATLAQRKMTRAGGSETLTYAMYRDAGRTQVWGDGSGGSATVTNTGTGAAQTATIYGMVPAQSAPPPGNYVDTVTVTVTF